MYKSFNYLAPVGTSDNRNLITPLRCTNPLSELSALVAWPKWILHLRDVSKRLIKENVKLLRHHIRLIKIDWSLTVWILFDISFTFGNKSNRHSSSDILDTCLRVAKSRFSLWVWRTTCSQSINQSITLVSFYAFHHSNLKQKKCYIWEICLLCRDRSYEIQFANVV
jgi:hypothetical protein